MMTLAPRVIVRWRMSKPWPWHEFEAYLATPLVQLRGEYGIEVVTAG